MANTFLSCDDIARKMNKAFVGINNKSRLCIKGYVGVNGKARLVYPRNIPIPTVSGNYEYNNKEQYAVIRHDDYKITIMNGITCAKNAGTYTVQFTPIYPFKWTDGTEELKQYQWVISKFTGKLVMEQRAWDGNPLMEWDVYEYNKNNERCNIAPIACQFSKKYAPDNWITITSQRTSLSSGIWAKYTYDSQQGSGHLMIEDYNDFGRGYFNIRFVIFESSNTNFSEVKR